jgi:hypothetical protein
MEVCRGERLQSGENSYPLGLLSNGYYTLTIRAKNGDMHYTKLVKQ